MGGTDEPDVVPSDVVTESIPVVPVRSPLRAWRFATVSLAVVVLFAIGLIAYLWTVSVRWQEHDDDLVASNYELGAQIAKQQAEIAKLEDSNSLLTEQLAASKDSVLALSNEKAQWDDDAAFAQLQVTTATKQLNQAITVSNQLARCAEGQDQLVGYLNEPGDFTTQQIADFATSVDALCQEARQAKQDLDESLTK